ncbi:MAG: response regulator [Thiohalomonadales bacterium]
MAIFVGFVLCLSIIINFIYELESVEAELKNRAKSEGFAIANAITDQFSYLYNSLSSISRLPTLRNMHAVSQSSFVRDKDMVQILYSLLYSIIKIPAIFVIPPNFDPNRIDSHTGKLQVPILTLEMHTGDNPRDAAGLETEAVGDVDIQKYNIMTQQMEWFQKNFPRLTDAHSVSYPALISDELITSVKPSYSLHNIDNSNRSGIIVSVPIYDDNSNLSGMVSGIFPINVFRSLINNNHTSIQNTNNDFSVDGSGESILFQDFHQADDLLFSSSLPLSIRDSVGRWRLETVYAKHEFWGHPKVKATYLFSLVAILFTILLTMRISSLIKYYILQNDKKEKHNIALEKKLLAGDSALQISEAKSSAILATAADGIMILNKNGVIQTFNQAAERVFGYLAEEVIGRSINLLIPDIALGELSSYLNEYDTSKSVCKINNNGYEFTGVRKNKHTYSLEMNVSEMFVGDSTLYTGIFRDITNRKRAEQAINSARDQAEQATRSKSEFLANMSHELRTPLNAILGYCEILQDQSEVTDYEQYHKDLNQIHKSGKQLLHHVDEILDLAKIESGKMELMLESFDVHELIEQVIESVNIIVLENKNVINTDFCDIKTRFEADRGKVQQILVNLISNATKFTAGGTITIKTLQNKKYGLDWLKMTISDTGIGMTEDQANRIFDEFTQADSSTTKEYGGTGLGLTISRHFCEMMGGMISVESKPGVGTAVSVNLPMLVVGPKIDPVSVRFQSVTPGDPAARRIKISRVLIVGDDNISKELIERFLTREGFFADVVGSAQQALAQMQLCRPDIIVIDENSLDFDSWGSINQIKNHRMFASIPIIMLTKSDSQRLAKAVGATDYLPKPVQRSRLLDIVKKYIRDYDDDGKARDHILVVDDDEGNRTLLRRMLEAEGINVALAENGQVGLARVSEKEPALIFLDLKMPIMDGFEFAEKLRANKEWKNIPIISVTGYDLSSDEKNRISGFVDTMLSKQDLEPAVVLGEMREALLKHVRGKS